MKQFTSILFSLVFVMGLGIEKSWGENGWPASETSKAKADAACSEGIWKDIYKSESICRTCTINPSAYVCSEDSRLDGQKATAKSDCSTAMEKYNTSILKNPCKTASKANDCQKKINECIQNTTDAIGAGTAGMEITGNEAVDGLANQFLERLKAKNTKDDQQNSSTAFQPDRSCYKKFRVTSEEQKKARADKIKELKKDIEDEKKKVHEANEKMKKEASEIAEKKRESNAETAKALLKLDVEARKKLSDLNDKINEATEKTRKFTYEIVEEKEKKEALQFKHQQKIMDFAEDKIDQQCKNAVNKAKQCAKTKKGTTLGKDDPCADFTVTGGGPKATAEFKRKLKQLNDSCFELSNNNKATVKYEYATQLRKFDREIEKKQEAIKSALAEVEAKKAENITLTKENATEKSQEQKNIEEQMANFAQKLEDLKENHADVVKTSDAIIAERNKDLEALKAGKLAFDLGMDDEAVYEDVANEANNALVGIRSASSTAFGACCMESNDKKKPATKPGSGADPKFCLRLKTESNEDEKQEKAYKKSRNGNQK